MAGSRLEKVGTIFSRTSGLIQSGALNFQDRPLWYDLYKAYPPKEEPCYDRPAPNMKLKTIFYQEDKIRAMFHRNNKQIGVISLLSDRKSLTQRFIDTYITLTEQYKDNDGATKEKLYAEAIHVLNRERQLKKENEAADIQEGETISLSSSFKEAKRKLEGDINIKLKDIFH